MINKSDRYNEYIDSNKVRVFAKIVHRNINNYAEKLEINVNANNQFVFTIFSKIPTENLEVTIKSPFEVALDTSKMQSQLANEGDTIQDLWYLYMITFCPSSYKKDYFHFWLDKYKQNYNYDEKDFKVLKDYLIDKQKNLEYNAAVRDSLKEID